MKQLILFTSFFCIQTTFAKEIFCLSKLNEKLYYSQGQLKFTALINSSFEFSRVQLSDSISDSNGFYEDELVGKIKGNYTKFEAADAWCNYKISIPNSFMTSKKTIMFLDAKCEDGNKLNIRLYCTIK